MNYAQPTVGGRGKLSTPFPTPSGVSGTTGWAVISRTVRDGDEVKVKDCKEDIDTLLVFVRVFSDLYARFLTRESKAGLFSAVLTAFVIESYRLLQQDNSTVIITLLQQLVFQTNGYTITDGVISTSAQPFTTPPPFRPPPLAVPVNVLWFASLLLGLITASFGMLVKQWLREYLAMEYTSPQAQLRARHFRHPGIRDWRVFEIAALLPALLQMALALFFLGLCLFTWSVHASIGLTAVPLVSGWVALLVFVVIAPVFSPRCPFKAPLLYGITKFARVKVVSRVRLHARALWRRTCQTYVGARDSLCEDFH